MNEVKTGSGIVYIKLTIEDLECLKEYRKVQIIEEGWIYNIKVVE